MLEELRDAGITDYLCYLTPFSSEASPGPDARGIMGSWATDRPSGFGDEDPRVFARIQRRRAIRRPDAACSARKPDRQARRPHPGTCGFVTVVMAGTR